MICGANYGTGDRWKAGICGRPEGHPPISQDGVGHSPHFAASDHQAMCNQPCIDPDGRDVLCGRPVGHPTKEEDRWGCVSFALVSDGISDEGLVKFDLLAPRDEVAR